MNRYRFQIQSCIDVEVKGDTAEQARHELINNLTNYADEMISPATYVSEGVKVKS